MRPIYALDIGARPAGKLPKLGNGDFWFGQWAVFFFY